LHGPLAARVARRGQDAADEHCLPRTCWCHLRRRQDRAGERLLAGAAPRHLSEGLEADYDGEKASQAKTEVKGAHRQTCGLRYPSESHYCCLISESTVGSVSVVVSPSTRPSATSRSKRRMIFALRVLGSSAVK